MARTPFAGSILVGAVGAARDATKGRPGYWADLNSERMNEDHADANQLARARRSYGDMPLVVLDAVPGGWHVGSWTPCGSYASAIAACMRLGVVWLDKMAAQSERGVNCVVYETGHHIQIDKPQVVIAAVKQVILLIGLSAKPSCASL